MTPVGRRSFPFGSFYKIQEKKNMSTRNILKQLLAIGLLALASALPSQAAEVGGVKIDDAVTVEGKPLKLNGAGIRTKFVFKVYAMGLYLTDHKTTPTEVQA